jgi:hypothetical protein
MKREAKEVEFAAGVDHRQPRLLVFFNWNVVPCTFPDGENGIFLAIGTLFYKKRPQ